MKKLKKILITFVATISALTLLPQAAFADTLGQITSYEDTVHSNPVEDSSGDLWFISNINTYNWGTWTTEGRIKKFNRSTSISTSYNIGLNKGVDDILIGPDGKLWFSYGTPQGARKIAKMNLDGTNHQEFNLYEPLGKLTVGPDGRIWYAGNKQVSQNPTSYSKVIVKINSDGSTFTEQPYANEYDDKKHESFISDPQHNTMWEILSRNHYDAATGESIDETFVSKIDLRGNRTTGEIEIPYNTSTHWGALGPDGKLWFASAGQNFSYGYRAGYINSIDQNMSVSIHKIPDSIASGSAGSIAFDDNGYLWYALHPPTTGSRLIRIDVANGLDEVIAENDISMQYQLTNGMRAGLLRSISDGNIWFSTSSHADSLRRINKIGTGITGTTDTTDTDHDGLSLAKETIQGTEDTNADTDSDGLNDFKESQWFPDRNALFCNPSATSCEYPNPTERDIYIELDWMTRPQSIGNPTAYETKPTSSEVQPVKDAFTNKDINLHIDLGQLGGSNEVPYEERISFEPDPINIDFYDYKEGGTGLLSRNFTANRTGTYHYLLSGYEYTSGSSRNSGVAFSGDDDFFISYGSLKEEFGFSPSEFATAFAGAMIHELGHNLCLSSGTYLGQSPDCQFDGIDNQTDPTYGSAMNYLYQHTTIDYSNGTNGIVDHNDWAAIEVGDFIGSTDGDAQHGTALALQKKFKNNRSAMKKSPEYKQFVKDIEKLKKKIDHHRNH